MSKRSLRQRKVIAVSKNWRPFVCKECGASYKYRGNLQDHTTFFHMKGSIPCSDCPKVFKTGADVRKHRAQHSILEGRCPHCRSPINKGRIDNTKSYQLYYFKHLNNCGRRPISKYRAILSQEFIDETFNEMLMISKGKPEEILLSSSSESSSCSLVPDTDGFLSPSFRAGLKASPSRLDTTEGLLSKSFRAGLKPSSSSSSSSSSRDSSPNRRLTESCLQCNMYFSNESELEVHLRERHHIPPQAPNILYTYTCNESQVSNEEEEEVEAEGSFFLVSCEKCQAMFRDNETWLKHQCQATCPYVTCKECGKRFEEAESWKWHLRKCLRGGQTRVVLEGPMREEEILNWVGICNGTLVRWVCRFCKARFTQRTLMRMHKNTCNMQKH